MRPVEEVLPFAKRDEVRSAGLAQVRWYNPWLPLWDLVRGTYVRKPT